VPKNSHAIDLTPGPRSEISERGGKAMKDTRNGQGHTVPWYFWTVGVLALFWNGFGTFLWAGTTFMPDAFLSGLPAAHRVYVDGLPAWSTLTWGLGVLGGLAGSILLLMRKGAAVPAFALSLFGAVTNTMVYLTNPAPEGFFNLPLTSFIIGFAFFLFWFAYSARRRGLI
jgi:hypothetical protein